MFSWGQLAWGPVFLVILVFALVAGPAGGEQRYIRVLLTLFWVLALLSFFAPDEGVMERTRRLNFTSTLRLVMFPMLVATCLTVSAIGRLSWPRGLSAIVPTLVLIIHVVHGEFPQPPSFSEAVAVAAATVAGLWGLARGWFVGSARWLATRRVVAGGLAAAVLVVSAAGVMLLESKRDLARYVHYSNSIDYHRIPRHLVNAWQACDDPGDPHVVALTRRHRNDGKESMLHTTTRWFFYPPLGSRLQNKVVWASVHELRDLPSPAYLGGLHGGGDERIWMQNLQRLGVDRVLLEFGAIPEEQWIQARPDAFTPINQGETYCVYRVDRRAVSLALLSRSVSPLPSEQPRDGNRDGLEAAGEVVAGTP
jgi:hypothetical protein